MKQTRTASMIPVFLAHGLVATLLAGTFVPLVPAHAAPLTTSEVNGRVGRVVDGDTLILVTHSGAKLTIRLAGIDAPEKAMPFGDSATKMLSNLVGSGEVTVQMTKTDRYGRAIGKVLSQDSDVNLALIRHGMAWHYIRYAHEQTSEDADAYAKAETEARKNTVGLWLAPKPMPPWLYRRCRKSSLDCITPEIGAALGEEKSAEHP